MLPPPVPPWRAFSQDLSDHSSDAAFLKAFWSQPGAAAAATNLASVLRTSQHGAKVNGPGQSDLDSVLGVLASATIPLGFADKNAYMTFNSSLMNGLARAGYPNAVALFQGSSVTGIRAKTRELVDDNPNDYDVALCDPDLYSAAKDIGVGLRNEPARTDPLAEDQADRLGLGSLQQELTEQAGRPVNIMIYENVRAAQQYKSSMRVPFSYQIENYFAKQAQRAAQEEITLEIGHAPGGRGRIGSGRGRSGSRSGGRSDGTRGRRRVDIPVPIAQEDRRDTSL